MRTIKIMDIIETTFEDGSYWVEYYVGEKMGYLLTSELYEDDVDTLQEWIDGEKFCTESMVNKKDLSVCSKYLAELIEECRQSENEMWFVEMGEITEEKMEEVRAEVEKLGLEEYVEVGTDGEAITVFGGVITQFLF